MSDIKTTCPQCGAQGTAGRFCEYCGTKIPIPIIEREEDDENESFSWYDVCPSDWEPAFDNVIGDASQSLYMVVKKLNIVTPKPRGLDVMVNLNASLDESRRKNLYCIINRKGKFVCGKKEYETTLYVDNYDYISDYTLYNINSNEVLKLARNVAFGDYYITYMEEDRFHSKIGFLNRKSRTSVVLDKDIPYNKYVNYFDIKSCSDNLFVFKQRIDKDGIEKEIKYTVEINDDQGSVTYSETIIEIAKNNTKGTGCLVLLLPLLPLLYFLL